MECSFCKTVGKLLPKDRNYFVRPMSHELKNNFFRKNSLQLIQIILWIRKFRFWSSHWKFFGERPKLFCSVSEKERKIYFVTKFFKMILWTRKMQLWKPRRESSSKKVKYFLPNVRRRSKNMVFWRKHFSQSVSLEM